jgi:hypothetical protein
MASGSFFMTNLSFGPMTRASTARALFRAFFRPKPDRNAVARLSELTAGSKGAISGNNAGNGSARAAQGRPVQGAGVMLEWMTERRMGTRGHLTHLLYWLGQKKRRK